MKQQRITSTSLDDDTQGHTDWARLNRMTDEDVHQAAQQDSDAQPTTPGDWADAVILDPEDHERVQSGQIRMQDLMAQRKHEKQKKTSQVHIRIAERLKEQADERAESLGLDLSSWIRMVMTKELGHR